MDPFVFETRFARNGRGAPEDVCPPLKARSGDTGRGDAAPYVVHEVPMARQVPEDEAEVYNPYRTQLEPGRGEDGWLEVFRPDVVHNALTKESPAKGPSVVVTPVTDLPPDTIHVGPWHAARATVAPPLGRQLTVVSLFTGIGGFDLGFELTGAMTTVAQVEIDKHCSRVLEKHWPDVARYADVRTFGAESLRDVLRHRRDAGGGGDAPAAADGEPTPCGGSNPSIRREGGRDEFKGEGGDPAVDQPRSVARQLGLAPGGVDVVCGGFPCQDLSVAGKRAGLDGARSGLWFEFHRILRELRPRWAIVENVPGLLSSAGGQDLRVVLEGLEELYPGAWGYAVLDSQEFGVPQRRRRVFIVAGPSREGVAQVLSLCQGCGGHPEESSGPGEEVAGTLGGGSGSRGWAADTDRMTFVPGWTEGDGGFVNVYAPDVAYCVAARDAKGVSKLEGQTTLVASDVARPLLGKSNDSHAEDMQTYVVEDAVAGALAAMVPEVAFTLDGASHQAVGVLGDHHSHALTGEQGFDASEDGTGRGTPVVAIDTMGVDVRRGDTAEGIALTLEAEESGTGLGVVAIRTGNTKANGDHVQEDASYTLEPSNRQAVVHDAAAIVERRREGGRQLETQEEKAYALLNPGEGSRTQERQIVYDVDEPGHDDARAFVVSEQMNGFYAERDVSYTIPAQPPSDGSNLQYGVQYEEPRVVGPLSANGGTERKHGYGMGQQDWENGYAVPVTDTVVRRLTPIECARLQGFPDDWTCLCDTPSLCKCADGPQYKVYGNAVTVSVLQYLGGRIVAFEREAGRI